MGSSYVRRTQDREPARQTAQKRRGRPGKRGNWRWRSQKKKEIKLSEVGSSKAKISEKTKTSPKSDQIQKKRRRGVLSDALGGKLHREERTPPERIKGKWALT